MDTRFDLALFTPTEVADYLSIPRATLRSWLGTVTQLPANRLDTSIPFAGMAEARVVKELRHAGLSMLAIRDAAKTLTLELGVRHPLIWRGLAHNGRDILRRYEDGWERARDRQKGIPEVVEIGLQSVSWADDEYPESLRLDNFDNANVVVDPRFAFGQPILWDSGVRVEDIIDAVEAGDPLDVITDEYGVSGNDVLALAQFELRRRAAVGRRQVGAAA
jgi:uncharacterized protein (DUF433 family)